MIDFQNCGHIESFQQKEFVHVYSPKIEWN